MIGTACGDYGPTAFIAASRRPEAPSQPGYGAGYVGISMDSKRPGAVFFEVQVLRRKS